MTIVQKRLLYMGNCVKRILEENNIPYMITFGTLLGAVRHGGFIPWDDDFDFMLFDDTYEEAVRILKEKLPDDLFVEDEFSEPLYFHGWVHVKDKNSKVHYKQYTDDSVYKNQGLHLDLYKATKIKENRLEEFYINGHIEYLGRKFRKKIIPENQYLKKIAELNQKLENVREIDSENYIYGLNVPEKSIEIKDVLPLKKYQFEDSCFLGPANADSVLTHFYGDYMELPSLDKRVPHYERVDFITFEDESMKLTQK